MGVCKVSARGRGFVVRRFDLRCDELLATIADVPTIPRLAMKALVATVAPAVSPHTRDLAIGSFARSWVADEHWAAVAAAAQTFGRELVAQAAATDAEIEEGFAALVKAGATALLVQNDPFFDSRRSQIVALSSRHRMPGIFHIREFPADGGLMSYGASLSDTYRQVGVYAGKILRGAKPDNLPVLRPTRFEMVINMQTAKTLGLAVPQPILIASDELIE